LNKQEGGEGGSLFGVVGFIFMGGISHEYKLNHPVSSLIYTRVSSVHHRGSTIDDGKSDGTVSS
jgi:hypothetical protein